MCVCVCVYVRINAWIAQCGMWNASLDGGVCVYVGVYVCGCVGVWVFDLGSAPASATMREMCVFRFAAEPGGP